MGEKMSKEAIEARRAYQREYRCKNRAMINSRKRCWSHNNPDKVREHQRRYWENVAGKELRASWPDYGIDERRLKELQKAARSGEYADMVRDAAIRANKDAAELLILSVTKDMSYDQLQIRQDLGEISWIPLGRTDFYGARRLLFHYLDVALKEAEEDGRRQTARQA